MITQIIWLVSWPIVMFVTYKLVLWALKKFDQKRSVSADS